MSARHGTERQRGVGLIEVLVALVVLSVGFLTAGSMQLRALRDNQNAYHGSQARLLLDDMMDRMRNNPRGVRAGHYDGTSTADVAAGGTDCAASPCSPAALAAYDMAEWARSLDPGTSGVAPRLPGNDDGTPATGTIGAPVGGVYTLTLAWKALVDGELEEIGATARFVP